MPPPPDESFHPRPRTIKRTLLMVLLLLTGGATINVAVAWGCATWVSAIDHGSCVWGWISDSNLPENRHWWVMRCDACGASRISTVVPNPVQPSGVNDEHALFPPWCDLREAMDRRSEDAKAETIELNLYPAISVPNSLVADGRGWPFLSMTCSWDYGTVVSTTPKGERLKGGIELSPFEGAGDRGMIPYYRALPYHLLWPGFIVNTIFYAAILWVVWISSSKIRRIVIARSRIKRHRCAACGYQIAEGVGPVCSECGHPLTKASS